VVGPDGQAIVAYVNEKDAPLIAAAPDLLAALELMVAQELEVWPPNDWEMNVSIAQAAIAKAKGSDIVAP
jgi:hypothetical protein